MRVAIWDLEFFDYKADRSVLLCTGIKPLGKPPKMLYQGREGANDRELIRATVAELEKYNLLVGYYTLGGWRGRSGGDYRLLRTRGYKWRMPVIERRFHLDLWKVADRAFSTARHSLKSISALRGNNDKGSIEWDNWCLAAFGGDKRALKTIVDHCKECLSTTEKTYWDMINEPDLITQIKRV